MKFSLHIHFNVRYKWMLFLPLWQSNFQHLVGDGMFCSKVIYDIFKINRLHGFQTEKSILKCFFGIWFESYIRNQNSVFYPFCLEVIQWVIRWINAVLTYTNLWLWILYSICFWYLYFLHLLWYVYDQINYEAK